MTAKIPPVSIGVPVFNGENYLKSALDSLQRQTFTDFEVIISDNASVDGTEEICRQYASEDPRIRYFRQPENRGVAWNFNETFRLARGEYFKWLAHDDLCHPAFLERSMAVLEQDPSIALCYSKVRLIDSSGKRVGLVDDRNRSRRDNLASGSPHRRYADILMNCVFGAELYGLIRSDLLRSTRLFRSYCLAEKVLIAELALHGRVYEIAAELLSWRQHAEQYTQAESHKERAVATNPNCTRWFFWPYRMQSTLGYLGVVLRGKIGPAEKAMCLLVWLRYLLQWRKWRRVVQEAVVGKVSSNLPCSKASA